MSAVLVIGGGLAGCVTALELASRGIGTVIVEKDRRLGGKVRDYGCKAASRCNQCGLCIVGDLWARVSEHSDIEVLTESRLVDLIGTKGNYKAVVRDKNGSRVIDGISDIVVSIGFDGASSATSAQVQYSGGRGVISGLKLEQLLAQRGRHGIFDEAPSRIAFLQCFGSRDIQEKAPYCSRVCCGYSTRAARVIRHHYPETEITFFYMDLQEVEGGTYFDVLKKENIEFIPCRPVSIVKGSPNRVLYEQPGSGGRLVEREFDLIVLSEGIHPAADSDRIAEICTLGYDRNGFLKTISDSGKTGIYLAGCVSGPKKIPEVYAESLQVAQQIWGGVR